MEQIEWIANKSVLFVILGLFYWPSAFSIFVSLVGFFFPSCLEAKTKARNKKTTRTTGEPRRTHSKKNDNGNKIEVDADSIPHTPLIHPTNCLTS